MGAPIAEFISGSSRRSQGSQDDCHCQRARGGEHAQPAEEGGAERRPAGTALTRPDRCPGGYDAECEQRNAGHGQAADRQRDRLGYEQPVEGDDPGNDDQAGEQEADRRDGFALGQLQRNMPAERGAISTVAAPSEASTVARADEDSKGAAPLSSETPAGRPYESDAASVPAFMTTTTVVAPSAVRV
jgi:hypothetical protein